MIFFFKGLLYLYEIKAYIASSNSQKWSNQHLSKEKNLKPTLATMQKPILAKSLPVFKMSKIKPSMSTHSLTTGLVKIEKPVGPLEF